MNAITTYITSTCDTCKRTFGTSTAKLDEQVSLLAMHRWRVIGEMVICPDCWYRHELIQSQILSLLPVTLQAMWRREFGDVLGLDDGSGSAAGS